MKIDKKRNRFDIRNYAAELKVRCILAGADQAELAAKALKFVSCRLTNVEGRSQLLAILYGLATVAAITRSYALADELQILVRICRRDPQYALSIEEVIRICFVAASSRKGLKEWRDFEVHNLLH